MRRFIPRDAGQPGEAGTVSRVAIFAPYLSPVGTEPVMLSIARGLADSGHQVELLRVYDEWQRGVQPPLQVVDIGAGRFLPRLPRHGKAFRLTTFILSAITLPRLTWYLRRQRPHVLLASLLTAVPLVAASLARSNTRVIVSIQGFPKDGVLRRILWRMLYPRAYATVAPTKGIGRATELLSGLPAGSIAVIGNPVVNEEMFRLAVLPAEHPWFIDRNVPIVLAVGRLTRQKGFDVLIDAFARVRAVMSARLVILGEGEDRPRLERQIRQHSLEHHVWMPGHVSNPYAFMSKASVFVLSSRWEGPGHALIEAMALGRPCVATDCPWGPREIMGSDESAGILVAVDDPSGLADGLLKLLSDPLAAAAFGARASERTAGWTENECWRAYGSMVLQASEESVSAKSR